MFIIIFPYLVYFGLKIVFLIFIKQFLEHKSRNGGQKWLGNKLVLSFWNLKAIFHIKPILYDMIKMYKFFFSHWKYLNVFYNIIVCCNFDVSWMKPLIKVNKVCSTFAYVNKCFRIINFSILSHVENKLRLLLRNNKIKRWTWIPDRRSSQGRSTSNGWSVRVA